MSPELKSQIESAIGRTIVGSSPVGGGCIAHACRIDTTGGPLFVKSARGEAAGTFAAEATGLRTLRNAASPLVVPDVVAVNSETSVSPAFIVSEWVGQGPRRPGFWKQFGRGFASLHRNTSEMYGLDLPNFIGRLPQENKASDSWVSFFREQRLVPQIRMAMTFKRWPTAWDRLTEKLLRGLDDMLPVQPTPSLVHGDLWSGNFLCAADGRAALIDPAVYYGHREVDLAMSELFGGFESGFYQAYGEAWPLEPGYDERRELYNLYHLINHLNHFGHGYSEGVERTLKRFGS